MKLDYIYHSGFAIEADGITTPFLLARVAEITGGDSLASNIQLVYNNARLAAQTAAAYCQL